MRVCLMIEGQEDVTWDDWLALAGACEEHGVEALLRSDHYLSVEGRGERGSLDAWATISALATVTSTLRLGTLVSPVTLRHPSQLAKVVVTADHISGGRVELGLGTGWLEAEHEAYGFPFPPLADRMSMLEEQLELISRQWAPGAFSFDGRHYRVRELDALPKPLQRPPPSLIVGGSAGPRSLRLAAATPTSTTPPPVAPSSAGRSGATWTRPAGARAAIRSRCP
jgi:alkanesulfonate monooxygenase SsuD/methylene tetrahydromethanopterin reductase-like flavin-dependent oxidoreductase (luciferase family)